MEVNKERGERGGWREGIFWIKRLKYFQQKLKSRGFGALGGNRVESVYGVSQPVSYP